MELRVLRYFLAVAREQSISGAAKSLHLSQPTLSTQLRALEEELGKQLLVRGGNGSKKITLTEEGMLLRQRGEEIINLVQKTQTEIADSDKVIVGDIYIGAGETDTVRLLARAAKELSKTYPDIHYHIVSGNSIFVLDQLDKGLIDFGVVFGYVDELNYNAIPFPIKDRWGVFMRREDALAQKESIRPEDLWDKPLIVSKQGDGEGALTGWMKREVDQLNIVATYNLLFNASLMVEEGLGYAISIDKIINTSEGSSLCFRPLNPKREATLSLIWKKYQIMSKAAVKFLEQLGQEFF